MKKNRRRYQRTYFLPTHRLPALVEIESQLFEGKLVNRSEGGVAVKLALPSNVKRDLKTATTLFIGQMKHEFSVRNLRVVAVSKAKEKGLCLLHLACDDEPTKNALEEVFDKLIEPHGTFDKCPKKFKRLPTQRGVAHYSEDAINKRIEWVEERMGIELKHIPDDIFEPTMLAGNIERYIGSVQIPIGVAGPIPVRGTYTNADIPVPIATTEGALVSSITRGAMACHLAGGVKVEILHKSMLRAPIFFCEDARGALNLKYWIENHTRPIIEKAQSVSSVAVLKKLDCHILGTALHVRFYYDTGDAAGQNIATACTYIACEWIEDQVEGDDSVRLQNYMIEGNMSGDKKANIQNFIEGRGTAVTAHCRIKESILNKILRISSEEFVSSWQAAEMAASHIGMIGSNTNFANVIAGIFTATGQDIGSVHESSIGQIRAVKTKDGVEIMVVLPSLVIGTVGGGTGLPTQKEALQIMDCFGTGKVLRLAEIIAATCLCLDLSTMAAIRSNDFVNAHESLGRNRPNKYLSKSDINEKFIENIIDNPSVEVKRIEVLNSIKAHGMTTSMLQRKRKGLKDILRMSLTIGDDGKEYQRTAILKLKSPDAELVDVGIGLARLSGDDTLPGLFETYSDVFGYHNNHYREIEILKQIDPEVRQFCPEILGTLAEPQRDVFAILMEDLTEQAHLDSTNNIDVWNDEDIRLVLRNLAKIHGHYFNRFEPLKDAHVKKFDAKELIEAAEFLRHLSKYNATRYPELFSDKTMDTYDRFLSRLDDYAKRMEAYPMSLSHNDFNTRNLCLKKSENGSQMVAYDWELCCFQNPQHDLIEFLIFVLSNEDFNQKVTHYAQYYMERLHGHIDFTLKRKEFFAILHLNAVELAVRRFNLYFLAHNVVRFPFLERVFQNLTTFIQEPLKYLAPADGVPPKNRTSQN